LLRFFQNTPESVALDNDGQSSPVKMKGEQARGHKDKKLRENALSQADSLVNRVCANEY